MTATTLDLTPGSADWLRFVSASKVSAILGVSPWDSPYSMWLKMHGDLPGDDGKNTATKSRGHYLEPAILAWFFDQHPELVRRPNDQEPITRPDIPFGLATPDAIGDDVVTFEAVLVEAKSAANDDEWGTPGTDEIPPYYAAQIVWALHLSGLTVCYVPIITSRLEFREYVVRYDAALGAQIEATCRSFYDSLALDVAPPLDDHTATYESLRRINPDIEPDTEVELAPDLARRYVTARAAAAAADAEFIGAKSAVLDVLGKSKRATCAGQTIAQRQNTSAGIPALYPARKAVDLDALPSERTAA